MRSSAGRHPPTPGTRAARTLASLALTPTALAVMTAGTAMMPVGWTRLAFPAYFWVLMAYNGATAGETLRLVRELGVDGAAKKQMHLA